MIDRLNALVEKSDRVESLLEQYKDIRKTLEDLFESPADEKMGGLILVNDSTRVVKLPIEFHVSGEGPVNERVKGENITLKVMARQNGERPADVIYEKTVTSFEKTSFSAIEETLNDDTLTDLIKLIKGERVSGTASSSHHDLGVGFTATFEKVIASV